jgi:hypothetical protein
VGLPTLPRNYVPSVNLLSFWLAVQSLPIQLGLSCSDLQLFKDVYNAEEDARDIFLGRLDRWPNVDVLSIKGRCYHCFLGFWIKIVIE